MRRRSALRELPETQYHISHYFRDLATVAFRLKRRVHQCAPALCYYWKGNDAQGSKVYPGMWHFSTRRSSLVLQNFWLGLIEGRYMPSMCVRTIVLAPYGLLEIFIRTLPRSRSVRPGLECPSWSHSTSPLRASENRKISNSGKQQVLRFQASFQDGIQLVYRFSERKLIEVEPWTPVMNRKSPRPARVQMPGLHLPWARKFEIRNIVNFPLLGKLPQAF